MKNLILTLLLALICSFGFAQKSESIKIDSLETQLRNATNDTTKAKLILEIIDNVGRGRGNLLENLNNGRYAPVYDVYSNKLDVYEKS